MESFWVIYSMCFLVQASFEYVHVFSSELMLGINMYEENTLVFSDGYVTVPLFKL